MNILCRYYIYLGGKVVELSKIGVCNSSQRGHVHIAVAYTLLAIHLRDQSRARVRERICRARNLLRQHTLTSSSTSGELLAASI